MPASRSVYRTPNTMDVHSGDPQLTLEWSEHGNMAVSNGDGTPFDSQSEVGLISPKARNFFSGCCNSVRINSNWRVFALVTVILVLFVSGFITGYLTRRYVHKKYVVASLTVGTTDVEEYDDADTRIDYFYNYTEEVGTEFFHSINVSVMVEDLEEFTKVESHYAGTKGVETVANLVYSKLKDAGQAMQVQKYTSKVLLSLPCNNNAGNKLTEVEGGKEEWSSVDGDAYVAYAPIGSAVGPIVNASFGRNADFEQMRKDGTDPTGAIALIRFGRIPRYLKVQNAMAAGCVGVILYTETPKNQKWSGFDEWVGDAKNQSSFGSILSPDALPYVGSSILPPDASNYTANLQKSGKLPNIPVISISEMKALELGANENKDKKYKIESCTSITYANITNVVGILPGYIETDRFVIVAAHHDSWGPGGIDPHSGTAVMLGLARAAAGNAKLMRPRRSIMFVSFDAEEMGLIGSSEFVKRLETQFGAGVAVGAICLDGVLRGQFIPYIRADPIMRDIFISSSASIPSVSSYSDTADASSHSLFDEWRKRSNLVVNGKPYVGQLDTSSDHAMLSFYAGIPTAAVQYWYNFTERDNVTWYPAYHTALDTFDYVKHVDPEWKALRTVTMLTGDAMMRLADSVLLPLNCTSVADYISEALKGLQTIISDKTGLDKTLMDSAQLTDVSTKFKNSCKKLLDKDAALITINDSPSTKLRNRSWHYADIRERNDALLIALQAFVQQPIAYSGQYFVSQDSQSSSRDGDRRKQRQPGSHASPYMRHVLFPPSMKMDPYRSPGFFALHSAVNNYNNSVPNSAIAVNREFKRLFDGLEHATAILDRSVNLRQPK